MIECIFFFVHCYQFGFNFFLLPFDANGCQIPVILLKQNSQIFFSIIRLFLSLEIAGCFVLLKQPDVV